MDFDRACPGSAGGHLASLVGTLQGDEPFLEGACGDPTISSRVALVVNYAGPTKMPSHSGQYPRIDQFLGANYAPELAKQAEPASYISSDDSVFVIAQGTEDTEVAYRFSVSFADQLEAAGVETHLVLLEGAGHTFAPDDRYNLEVRRILEPVMRRLLDP